MNPLQSRQISENAFRNIRSLFAHESGIRLSHNKQGLVASRLNSRIQQLGLRDFDAYCELIANDEAGNERAYVVDSLTTHETYFFREPKHFQHLDSTVLPALRGKPVRVWCAAASTGEEAWSLAMTLAGALGNGAGSSRWGVVGSDISESSLVTAERGLYRMERLQHMPQNALKQFCLRGTDDFEGSLLINRKLRERVSFCQHNLLDSPQHLGKFDVIFLRNVLIYFDQDMRQKIVSRVLESLNPGGWLYTGHADTLMDLKLDLETVAPSIHRKPQHKITHAPVPARHTDNARLNAAAGRQAA
ncbi:protein-glutamate O-methyltransferase CheR [Uliginosibacterium sp. H3]|uniref:Chemotaxis protein methyltransferase n=1 Tax=Uliginosibacterium silvisoli TaxID=3114758 RepID=A0ABU6K8J2_9RHOO|nr:protein-glutamate O-methyltransferase CheR [Uliginosibacterium sp. H3]